MRPTVIHDHDREPEPEPNPTTARRVAALTHARAVLDGLDVSPDDLIIVADWIDTGRADVALAMTAERYRQYHRTTTQTDDDATDPTH